MPAKFPIHCFSNGKGKKGLVRALRLPFIKVLYLFIGQSGTQWNALHLTSPS